MCRQRYVNELNMTIRQAHVRLVVSPDGCADAGLLKPDDVLRSVWENGQEKKIDRKNTHQQPSTRYNQHILRVAGVFTALNQLF